MFICLYIAGTVVITDEWKGYCGIAAALNGIHVTVNHSVAFVNVRQPDVHTNTVESSWSRTKKKIHSYEEGSIESHVMSSLFWDEILKEPFDAKKPKRPRIVRSHGERFERMLSGIRAVYSPQFGGQQPLKYPPRVVVPSKAHPRLVKVINYVLYKYISDYRYKFRTCRVHVFTQRLTNNTLLGW
jgi:hypothetical protein